MKVDSSHAIPTRSAAVNVSVIKTQFPTANLTSPPDVLSTTPYPFAIDAEGALYRTGRPDARMCAPVYNPTQDYPYALWELTDAMSLVYNWPKVLPCAVSPVDLELTCARGDPTVSAWFMCIPSSNTNTFLVLGKPKGPDNQTWCTPIKLYAEPV